MTQQQKVAVESLKRDGFKVIQDTHGAICLARGNDYRLVKQDGRQQRAKRDLYLKPTQRKPQ